MLVKPEAAEQVVHCPVCKRAIKVPELDTLRKMTARGLEVKVPARDRVHTEDLLLLVDDDEGPGTEVS
jgi:hypothetical protein